MADRDLIQSVVFEAIDDLNNTLPVDERLDKRADVPLFGKEGKLDSLGIVDLVMTVEQRLTDKIGVTVSAFNDRATSDRANPFATVARFVDHLTLLVDEKAAR